jgi:ABC-2 type transport system ATP-binding protein
MEEAENLCDYIIIMDRGTILKEGTLHQLLEEETGEKVVEFSAEKELSGSFFENGVLPFKLHPGGSPGKGYFNITSFENDIPAFISFMKSKNIPLKFMECRRKTLDDLFVSLTGRKINE